VLARRIADFPALVALLLLGSHGGPTDYLTVAATRIAVLPARPRILRAANNAAVVAAWITDLPALVALLNLHLVLVFKIANSSADLAASAAAAHASAHSRTVESKSLLALYSVAAFAHTDPGRAGGKDDLDGAFGDGRGDEDGVLGQRVGACGAACVRGAGVAAVVVERGALQHLVDDLVGGDGLGLDEAASETIITL
jgi:hypothetical protein